MKFKYLTKEDVPTFFIILGTFLVAFGVVWWTPIGITIGLMMFAISSGIGMTYFFMVKKLGLDFKESKQEKVKQK